MYQINFFLLGSDSHWVASFSQTMEKGTILISWGRIFSQHSHELESELSKILTYQTGYNVFYSG